MAPRAIISLMSGRIPKGASYSCGWCVFYTKPGSAYIWPTLAARWACWLDGAEVDLEGVCDAWELCAPPANDPESAAYWATLSAHDKAARVAVKLTSYVVPERSVDASHQGPQD